MKAFLIAVMSIIFATAAMAQSGYQIRSGDTLQIEVLEDPSLNRSVLVLPDGSISFPFAGSIRAGGRSAGQVSSAISSGIASNFATTPTVFVTVQQLRPVVQDTAEALAVTIDVYMMGEITAPGEKKLAPGTTLIQALATTGGFTPFAATKRILLRRTDANGNQSVSRINYKAIADGAAIGQDIRLRDGDVIIVPERRLFE